jgi:amino acid adenylation domain-containing protein
MDDTATLGLIDQLTRTDGPCIAWQPAQTVDQRIIASAATSPSAVAVIDRHGAMSYRELIERAADIAAALHERQIARGARVGVILDASAELVATILAIWSLGATYVPLDPILPRLRVKRIVADAAITAIVSERAHRAEAGEFAPLLWIEDVRRRERSPFSSRARLEDNAYVVYTSGSTGVPKGVEIPHAGLANTIFASNEMIGLGCDDRLLYRTSISFDVSIYEMFGPLATGGTVVIVPRLGWDDPRELVAAILLHAVTAISVSSSFLAVLLDEPMFAQCSSLRLVTSGTDTMSLDLFRRFLTKSSALLYNGYGPSEATIVVTAHRCEVADLGSDEESIPLGAPLPNTHVSVRDTELLPVAPGGTGEIVIGGVQLARGYLGSPEETAARFISDPIRRGERIYRTGDLARVRADGSIVFLGRNDKQVKIHGQRVEPGEVAAAIEGCDGVRTAVVIAERRHRAGMLNGPAVALVAYVTALAGASVKPEAVAEALRERLPPAMVPGKIVVVNDFPLTVTGKIDEAALQARSPSSSPHVPAALAPTYPASRLAVLHEHLRAIWEDLLDHDGVNDHDNFFDIGGDSLLAVRMMIILEETFGRRVPLAEFFDTSMTIPALAEILSKRVSVDEPNAALLNEHGSRVPLALLHGDFGGGMYAWSLARKLGSEQPVLVIPPHGMLGRPPAKSVQGMAADMVSIITGTYPNGPLRIAGYSASGLIAFEAARMLRDAGRDIRDVVVIAMGAENAAFSDFERILRRLPLPTPWTDRLMHGIIRLGTKLSHFADATWRERALRIAKRLQAAPASVIKKPQIEDTDGYRRYIKAQETYVPGRYNGRLTVLWPIEQRVEDGDIERDWRRVAPSAEIAYVPGSHHTAVSRHVSDIADTMERLFASA